MKRTTLGEIARWGSGGTPRRGNPEYFGTGMPWVSIADLNDGVVSAAKESLTAAGLANSSAKVVPAGTILVAMYGSIGKLGIAGRNLCTSQAIAFAQPDESVVDPRFLFHFLLAQRSHLQARGRGGTQMNIGQADLKEWPISLPPLEEQRRIAAILDQADAIRAKRRQVLAHLDTLTQSIFHDMFDNTDLGSAVVGDVAEIQGGLQISSKRKDLPVKVAYLRVANAFRGRLDLTEVKSLTATEPEFLRTRLESGDLLFVEGHANPKEVGRVALWSGEVEPCVHQNHLIRARLDSSRVLPVYAAAWLNSDAGARHFRRSGRTTSGLNTISATTVRTAPLPLPPLQHQAAFARAVSAVEASRIRAQSAIQADDALFASLQSRAFKGEL